MIYIFKLALVSIEAVNGMAWNKLFGLSILPVVVPYTGNALLVILKLKKPGIVITGCEPLGNPLRLIVVVKSFLPFVKV